MRLGAHVPVRGGLRSAIDAARGIGAEAAQVFVSNPRGWAPPRVREDEAAAFREAWSASGLGPLVVHAPYLVNPASANPAFLERTRSLALATLAACEAYGADALVIHAGTGGADPHDEVVARAADTFRLVGAASTGPTRVLVELEEGITAASASTLAEAARLLEAAGDERLGLCLDTCHAFAAGYGLDTAAGVAELFDEARALGLLERLDLIHANDAKQPRGSRRDRHEDIGAGHIGAEGFRALLHRAEVRDVPFVLETPGGIETYAEQLALLRALAA